MVCLTRETTACLVWLFEPSSSSGEAQCPVSFLPSLPPLSALSQHLSSPIVNAKRRGSSLSLLSYSFTNLPLKIPSSTPSALLADYSTPFPTWSSEFPRFDLPGFARPRTPPTPPALPRQLKLGAGHCRLWAWRGSIQRPCAPPQPPNLLTDTGESKKANRGGWNVHLRKPTTTSVFWISIVRSFVSSTSRFFFSFTEPRTEAESKREHWIKCRESKG